MIPLPHLPRWQQYLLLVGALLAMFTGSCLHLAGHDQSSIFAPLLLPFLLWWPQPADRERRLYWWLAVVLVFSIVGGLLYHGLTAYTTDAF